jgi:DNA-binding CsgD family transcriptional regulator
MKDGPVSTQPSLVEPLTRRERKILALLAQDLSNREIAAAETLALSTVKWYIQQIYGKLGVSKRQEALARARDLGLVEQNHAPVSSRSLPSMPVGTVTFLFTDIVGSTPLWEKHPHEMIESLQIHNTVLRKCL